MSDVELRRLERRWLASRSLDDEAPYLRARLQQGLVTRRRLELTAGCGVASAQAVLGTLTGASVRIEHARAGDPDDTSVQHLRATLALRVRLRVLPLLGAAPYDLAAVEARHALDRLLAAIERWACCPCPEHAAPFAEKPRRRPWRSDALRTVAKDSELLRVSALAGEPAGMLSVPMLGPWFHAAVAERLRAWCLGEELPDLAPIAAALRVQAEAERAGHFCELLARGGTPRAPVAPSPSRWTSGRRVLPVLAGSDQDEAWFVHAFTLGPVEQLSAEALVRERLQRWAADGLLVVPIVPGRDEWAEVEPEALRDRVAARLGIDPPSA
jgi:hypothetical protein